MSDLQKFIKPKREVSAKHFHIRVTPELHAKAEALAEEYGTSLAELLRGLVEHAYADTFEE